jgi:hypothetical protein
MEAKLGDPNLGKELVHPIQNGELENVKQTELVHSIRGHKPVKPRAKARGSDARS